MNYKLFSLARDFASAAANEQQLCAASNVVQEGTMQAENAIFQLPQKNLTLGSADLASFWQKLE